MVQSSPNSSSNSSSSSSKERSREDGEYHKDETTVIELGIPLNSLITEEEGFVPSPPPSQKGRRKPSLPRFGALDSDEMLLAAPLVNNEPPAAVFSSSAFLDLSRSHRTSSSLDLFQTEELEVSGGRGALPLSAVWYDQIFEETFSLLQNEGNSVEPLLYFLAKRFDAPEAGYIWVQKCRSELVSVIGALKSLTPMEWRNFLGFPAGLILVLKRLFNNSSEGLKKSKKVNDEIEVAAVFKAGVTNKRKKVRQARGLASMSTIAPSAGSSSFCFEREDREVSFNSNRQQLLQQSPSLGTF